MRLRPRRDLMKSSSGSLLLSLLEQQSMYGYEIVKELEKRSKGYFKFKEGTLYPALHRLENSGLVTAKWQKPPNGRPRRYYYITPEGRARLVTEKTQWRGFLEAVKLILEPTRQKRMSGI
jgi:PadR family transcriptional regulator, regulatory protein PadR